MNSVKTKLGYGGRLVIPAPYGKALGIKPGDEVVLVLEESELSVVTARQAVQRAQALVRRYVPEGRSLSQELIRDHREQAARA